MIMTQIQKRILRSSVLHLLAVAMLTAMVFLDRKAAGYGIGVMIGLTISWGVSMIVITKDRV